MPDVRIFPDLEGASQEAARLFAAAASEAIADHYRFSVALSGGPTPRRLYQLLAAEPYRSQLPWGQIHFFWGDERYVPANHAESNYRMAKEALLDHISIPVDNIHPMPTDAPETEQAARVHSAELQIFFDGDICFDLALMGIGDDGHTASLFADDPALTVRDKPVAVARPTSQPTDRLTLTYPIFNRTRRVLFLVSGQEKALVVARVLAGDAAYPCTGIQPTGELIWLLDQAAAASLGEVK